MRAQYLYDARVDLNAGGERERLKMPAQLRLRRKSEFEAAYASGRRFSDGYFSVTVGPNKTGRPRLGMAVATKTAGNSVQRNRIRRQVRESFRLRQLEIPAVDLIVSARSRARGATNAELRASLAALWDKVINTCASPSKS
jgi:ribonuclease P protein component